MRAKELASLLCQAIPAKQRVLIKGKPGIGKSDLVTQVCESLKADLIISHPAISDPTDYKGMPAIVDNGARAEFLPFGDLEKLIDAKKPTVFFQDDIGQAAPAVQAALMQLNQARRINGHKISDTVVFIGATNDTNQMAGVSGMIEPLKSRWDAIIEMEVSLEDWCDWALDHSMPAELIAFIRFRPGLLSEFKPTKELKNSPCPRTWSAVGRWVNIGVKQLEVFIGCVGEGAATEFFSFLDLYQQLPSLDGILLNPDNAEVPTKPAAKYAVTCGLARKSTPANFERVIRYMSRMEKEFEVCAVKDAIRLSKQITSTPAFTTWAVKNQEILL